MREREMEHTQEWGKRVLFFLHLGTDELNPSCLTMHCTALALLIKC